MSANSDKGGGGGGGGVKNGQKFADVIYRFKVTFCMMLTQSAT